MTISDRSRLAQKCYSTTSATTTMYVCNVRTTIEIKLLLATENLSPQWAPILLHNGAYGWLTPQLTLVDAMTCHLWGITKLLIRGKVTRGRIYPRQFALMFNLASSSVDVVLLKDSRNSWSYIETNVVHEFCKCVANFAVPKGCVSTFGKMQRLRGRRFPRTGIHCDFLRFHP